MKKKKEFLDWLFGKKEEKEFTVQDVEELIEKIKEFNAGCIDEYLSRHVDKVFYQWLALHRTKSR